MNKYVLGFAFSEDRKNVLLMRKNRPKWQKGSLNGIGGKAKMLNRKHFPSSNPTGYTVRVKGMESPQMAIDRKCIEETNLSLKWNRQGFLHGTNMVGSEFTCDLFYAYSNCIWIYEQSGDEDLCVYTVDTLLESGLQMVTDLRFLIPYGQDSGGSRFLTLAY